MVWHIPEQSLSSLGPGWTFSKVGTTPEFAPGFVT